MSFCFQCGARINSAANFCPSCGVSIAKQSSDQSESSANVVSATEPKAGSTSANDRLPDQSAASPSQPSAANTEGPTLLKWIANGPTFVGLYLGCMIPTYLLPFGGSNSILNASMQNSGAPNAGHFKVLFLLHLGFLISLCVIAFLRGKYVGKQWLIVPPIVATVFDFIPILNWIPLIPTAMHLLALIVGASSSPVKGKSVERSDAQSTAHGATSSPNQKYLLPALACGLLFILGIAYILLPEQKKLDTNTYSTAVGGLQEQNQSRPKAPANGSPIAGQPPPPESALKLHDDFYGAEAESSLWVVDRGSGNDPVAFFDSGILIVGNGAVLKTVESRAISGSTIVIEARFAGPKESGRDSNVVLTELTSGDRIQIGDTNYQGLGLYTTGSGQFRIPQTGNGNSVRGFHEYRITIEGAKITVVRALQLGLPQQETWSAVLPNSIKGKKFMLSIGAGGNDGIYSPAHFDWIRVSTLD